MGDGNAFGRRLKDVRKRQGYTQKTLGVAVGKSAGAIYQWEKGNCLPDEETVTQLEKVLERDLHNAWWAAQDDEPEPEKPPPEQPTQTTGEDDGGEGDGLAPWHRDTDEWTACERKSREGLGTDQVTVRKNGALYFSSALAEAAGLGGGDRVTLYKSPRGGGLEADAEGAYKLSDEGKDCGYCVTATQFKGWTGESSLRADVTAVGDRWFAFDRPERN